VFPIIGIQFKLDTWLSLFKNLLSMIILLLKIPTNSGWSYWTYRWIRILCGFYSTTFFF